MVPSFLLEALAVAHNYGTTGRIDKCREVIFQIRRIEPTNKDAHLLHRYWTLGEAEIVQPEVEKRFGKDWRGEPLNGKSIEVFCEEGMGDTIQCLRYLREMKLRWDCQVVVNCFSHHNDIKRLVAASRQDDMDCFTQFHTPCDYHTNILSIPALMTGIPFAVYFPAHWRSLLDQPVPPQPVLCEFEPMFNEKSFRVGLSGQAKDQQRSVSLATFAILEDGVNELYSVNPSADRCNMMVQMPLKDLYETAKLMASLDAIVTVDTVTLHLAGALGKKTLVLLPYNADERWGTGSTTVWYPTVEIFRQPQNLDWYVPMQQIKDRLESLRLSL